MSKHEQNQLEHVHFRHRNEVLAFKATQECVVFRTVKGHFVIIGDVVSIHLGDSNSFQSVVVSEVVEKFGGLGTYKDVIVPAPLRKAVYEYFVKETSDEPALFRIPNGEFYFPEKVYNVSYWRKLCSLEPRPGYEKVRFVCKRTKIKSGESWAVGIYAGRRMWPKLFGHAIGYGSPLQIVDALPNVVVEDLGHPLDDYHADNVVDAVEVKACHLHPE
jgi:hypothetical protein